MAPKDSLIDMPIHDLELWLRQEIRKLSHKVLIEDHELLDIYTMLVHYTQYNKHHGFFIEIEACLDEATQAKYRAWAEPQLDDSIEKINQAYQGFKQSLKTINQHINTRVQISTYLNLLNYIYSVKESTSQMNIDLDDPLNFKAMETICLMSVNLALLSYHLYTLLYHLCSYSQDSESRKKIWNKHKYSILSVSMWLSINTMYCIQFFFPIAKPLPQLGLIGFSIELLLSILQLMELKTRHKKHQDFYVHEHADEAFRTYITQLQEKEKLEALCNRYQATTDVLEKQIILSLLINEQHYALEKNKLLGNLSINLIVFITSLILQENLLQALFSLQLSLNACLLISITVLYSCNILRGLILNYFIPEWTQNEIQLEEHLFLLHGKTSKSNHQIETQKTFYAMLQDLGIKLSIPVISMLLIFETNLNYDSVVMIFLGMLLLSWATTKCFDMYKPAEISMNEASIKPS